MRQPSVTSQLTTELKTSQALHRGLLEKEISSIKYLLRQGMTLRGKPHKASALIDLTVLKTDTLSIC